ncbi:signal peptidase I [Sphingomonas sp.]|uniref:signal peptidase I n=1 Tax=Sphingomonas sp. TaxID=28214 RepID=UPI003CC56BB4
MSRAARFGIAIALAGWAMIGIAIWLAWPAIGQMADPHRPKTCYIPSESMLPTLHVYDRLRPREAVEQDLRRGVVIVSQAPSAVRVARIVGVAGDVIALHAGILAVNGHSAVRRLGPGPLIDGAPTQLQAERLPGEAGEHRLLDAGPSIGDEFGPVSVPADYLFVLGDNLDRAADSRYQPDQLGVGMVHISAAIGIVDRLLWSAGFHDLGRPIDAVRR